MDVDGAVKLMAKETILVVEDEEDIRELLKYNLEKEGYQVFGAATGEEGLAGRPGPPARSDPAGPHAAGH